MQQVIEEALARHVADEHAPFSRKGRLNFTSTEGLAEFILRITRAIMEDHRTEEHEPPLGSVPWIDARMN